MNSFRVLFVPLLVVPVLTDYHCVCNYNVEERVFGTPCDSVRQPIIDYIYEFDCRPQAGPDIGDYYQVMYKKQIAYIHKNHNVQLQTCPGDIPDVDKLTTIAAQITTTSKPSTTTVHNTTPSSGIPEGHIEICPTYETGVNCFNGYLGQYGEFCYELVNQATQYVNAERHCAIVSTGHLVHVLNQDEQDYLVRFLNKHYVQNIWLGLTDSGTTNEVTWRWNSGAAYKYNNFAQHSSTDHKLHDCVILKQGGEWTDVPCGVTFVRGAGFGEKHPYICQYNVSSALPSILPGVVVG